MVEMFMHPYVHPPLPSPFTHYPPTGHIPLSTLMKAPGRGLVDWYSVTIADGGSAYLRLEMRLSVGMKFQTSLLKPSVKTRQESVELAGSKKGAFVTRFLGADPSSRSGTLGVAVLQGRGFDEQSSGKTCVQFQLLYPALLPEDDFTKLYETEKRTALEAGSVASTKSFVLESRKVELTRKHGNLMLLPFHGQLVPSDKKLGVSVDLSGFDSAGNESIASGILRVNPFSDPPESKVQWVELRNSEGNVVGAVYIRSILMLTVKFDGALLRPSVGAKQGVQERVGKKRDVVIAKKMGTDFARSGTLKIEVFEVRYAEC